MSAFHISYTPSKPNNFLKSEWALSNKGSPYQTLLFWCSWWFVSNLICRKSLRWRSTRKSPRRYKPQQEKIFFYLKNRPTVWVWYRLEQRLLVKYLEFVFFWKYLRSLDNFLLYITVFLIRIFIQKCCLANPKAFVPELYFPNFTPFNNAFSPLDPLSLVDDSPLSGKTAGNQFVVDFSSFEEICWKNGF